MKVTTKAQQSTRLPITYQFDKRRQKKIEKMLSLNPLPLKSIYTDENIKSSYISEGDLTPIVLKKVVGSNSMQGVGRDYLSERETVAMSNFLSAQRHHDAPRSRQDISRKYLSQDQMLKLGAGPDKLFPVLNPNKPDTRNFDLA
jgi:hypothetical protein